MVIWTACPPSPLTCVYLFRNSYLFFFPSLSLAFLLFDGGWYAGPSSFFFSPLPWTSWYCVITPSEPEDKAPGARLN